MMIMSMANLMRFLKLKEKAFDGRHLTLELRTDHSGCIKDNITLEVLDEWSTLDELSEHMIDTNRENDTVNGRQNGFNRSIK